MNEEIRKRIEQVKAGQVPEGYRKTQIGIVPKEWKETLFVEIFEAIDKRTNDSEQYPLYSLTIESGVVPKTDRYERSFLITKEVNFYKIIKSNFYVYNPMNLRFGAIGKYKVQTMFLSRGIMMYSK